MKTKCNPTSKKSTLLGIKGDLKASLLNKNLSSVNSQRDLGLIVSNKLTWNENCSRRTSKAISALLQIKRSLTMKSSVTTRLNAYTGYVVPIVTYASQAWTPSRSNMEKLERVQKLATKWILGTSKTYTERLKDLNLLPLNLCMEMHDILILIALLENRYEVEIERKPSELCKIIRQSSRGEFQILESRLQRTDDNFFRRVKHLYNCLIRACPTFSLRPSKATLTYIYQKYFKKMYSEVNKSTWKLLCRCGNCNVYNKLR